MKLILTTLIALFAYASCSQAAIEVYLGDKHFNSFEDYQKIKEGIPVAPVKMVIPVVKSNDDPALSLKEKMLLNRVAYDTGVHHVVVDFKQNWQNPKPKFILGADELEYTIRQAMEKHQEPSMLISEPGKMRIITYNFKKVASLGHKMQSVDKVSQKSDNRL